MDFAGKYKLEDGFLTTTVESLVAERISDGRRLLVHVFPSYEHGLTRSSPTDQIVECFRKLTGATVNVLDSGVDKDMLYAYVVTERLDRAVVGRWGQKAPEELEPSDSKTTAVYSGGSGRLKASDEEAGPEVKKGPGPFTREFLRLAGEERLLKESAQAAAQSNAPKSSSGVSAPESLTAIFAAILASDQPAKASAPDASSAPEIKNRTPIVSLPGGTIDEKTVPRSRPAEPIAAASDTPTSGMPLRSRPAAAAAASPNHELRVPQAPSPPAPTPQAKASSAQHNYVPPPAPPLPRPAPEPVANPLTPMFSPPEDEASAEPAEAPPQVVKRETKEAVPAPPTAKPPVPRPATRVPEPIAEPPQHPPADATRMFSGTVEPPSPGPSEYTRIISADALRQMAVGMNKAPATPGSAAAVPAVNPAFGPPAQVPPQRAPNAAAPWQVQAPQMPSAPPAAEGSGNWMPFIIMLNILVVLAVLVILIFVVIKHS